MSHQADCIFCRIISGEAPCYKLHEDELTISFLDAFPSSPGHALIVTRDHFSDLFTADAEAVARVAANSVSLAKALDTVFQPDGLGVYQLNRAAAGQTVFHYHMHLIPRNEGAGLNVHAKAPGDAADLEQYAESIRKALAEQ